jgi:hypothetical protein
MNYNASIRESQQRDISPEVNTERPKRKRHDHNIVGNLTPLSLSSPAANASRILRSIAELLVILLDFAQPV